MLHAFLVTFSPTVLVKVKALFEMSSFVFLNTNFLQYINFLFYYCSSIVCNVA